MGIRFKRQGGGTYNYSSATAPTSLGYGEPAVDSAGRIYVGSGTGSVVSRVSVADSCTTASSATSATRATTASRADNATNADHASRATFDMPLYRARFYASSWSSSDGKYTQTATCSAVDGGPTMTYSMRPSPPMTEATGIQSTDEALQETLSIINNGTSTPGYGQMTVSVWEKPETDINVYYYAR